MDKYEQLKQKIDEAKTKSLVMGEMKAFVELMVSMVDKSKKEFSNLSQENIDIIKEGIAYIEENHAKWDKSLDTKINTATGKFERDIALLRGLIAKVKTIKPRDGVDGVNPDPQDVVPLVLKEIKLPEYKETILDGRKEIVEKINTGAKKDVKIDFEQIEGTAKFGDALMNRAVSIVDQRTSFLINKVSNIQNQVDNSSNSGGGHTIEDEGTPLTQRTKLNFVGAGVTVTDDSGDDATVVTITTGAGGGDVTKVGTPVNNQVGVWTGDGTLEGDTALTFDTTTNTLSTTDVSLSNDLLLADGGIINWGAGNATISHTFAGGNLMTISGMSGITSSSDISVPDEVYGVGWDGNLEVPTKNAVYDKVQTLLSTSLGDGRIFVGDGTSTAQAVAMSGDVSIDNTGNTTVHSINGITFTPSDAGADAIFGWDDSVGAYENLTQAEARTVLGLGSAALVATDLSDLNEATIETAIDTLANLTSIQGRTVTLADAGADAILGWDDSANAYENLTQAEVLAVIGDASTTAKGVVELAINTEINTGTDATRAVTPDSLAGSYAGTKNENIYVLDALYLLTTGDGKAYFRIPSAYNGMNLVACAASVATTSSSGTPTIQIARGRQANATTAHAFADMLSTRITIDATEYDSKDATAAAVIDTANDDVATGDLIRVDVDVTGTGTKGLWVSLEFRLP